MACYELADDRWDLIIRLTEAAMNTSKIITQLTIMPMRKWDAVDTVIPTPQ